MRKFISIAGLLLLMLPALCVAEDKPPAVISDSWTIIPKAGHEMELEAALKEHMAHRVEKGDTRHWDVYVPVTGDKLNAYVVRSCCNEWSEMDSYRSWSYEHASEHFNETVHPHAEKYAHNFGSMNMENSHWPKGTEANLVGVTKFEIKQGHWSKFSKAMKKMSSLAKEHGWERNWSWSYPVHGGDTVQLATPFKNFAEMAPMEENFYQFVAKHLKSEKKADKLFAEFDSAVSSSHYSIYRHRKDLSMGHDDD